MKKFIFLILGLILISGCTNTPTNNSNPPIDTDLINVSQGQPINELDGAIRQFLNNIDPKCPFALEVNTARLTVVPLKGCDGIEPKLSENDQVKLSGKIDIVQGRPYLAVEKIEAIKIPPTNPTSVVEANNQFSFDLYSKYKSNEGNLFFSPYSISSALAMTYEGAREKTAEEMQKVLHLPEDRDKIRSNFLSINKNINKADKPYKLTVANALWTQQDYTLLEDYLKTIEKYYDGKATNLDFKTNTENSRKTINAWVEGKTNNKIKDLIPLGTLSDLTKLVLTNAIYFKANWSEQFEEKSTDDQNFKLSSGTNVRVKMMHKTEYYKYNEIDKLQILEMPYLENDLSMLVFLPKDKLSDIENSINADNLDKWKKDLKSEKVEVSFPKFRFETKYFMAKNLKEMGMPIAFSDRADFSGMDGSKNLTISEVIHQTFVDVTESGTEAAAATAVIMGIGSIPIQEKPKVFNADHPFIFIIQEKATGNILFIGRVSNPTK